ncbi:hypothetical protein FHX42_001391 [Saccharopolyspora lacisalsi]|uniref:Uncharacterized protein n=1 Tax=Halosaccharopolyspora lacisalsi TaxID=1000566 RepID=A0A839DPY4_9PSEU|nr:hypothetical protein [Halosaccharopolyspora lacisalsi]MBA8824062.1 hypothetical protein [Halosaccharopolyspora lacisalsi]
MNSAVSQPTATRPHPVRKNPEGPTLLRSLRTTDHEAAPRFRQLPAAKLPCNAETIKNTAARLRSEHVDVTTTRHGPLDVAVPPGR